MHRRLDAGPLVAALGGVLLVLSLFLHWFDGASGWQVYELADVLMLLIGGAAVAVAAGVLPAYAGRPLLITAVVLLVFLIVHAIDPPTPGTPLLGTVGSGSGRVYEYADVSVDRQVGLWLALAASLLLLAGAVLAETAIAVTVDLRGREPRAPRTSAVDRRAEPPAERPTSLLASDDDEDDADEPPRTQAMKVVPPDEAP